MNGVPAAVYDFKSRHFTGASTDYKAVAIKGCKKFGEGWKPVCNGPGGHGAADSCKKNGDAIYLGNYYKLADRNWGRDWKNVPDGLVNYKDKFRADAMCFYTGFKKAACA